MAERILMKGNKTVVRQPFAPACDTILGIHYTAEQLLSIWAGDCRGWRSILQSESELA